MANTAEGITVGEQEGLDPNDPAAFEAIMADRGIAKEPGEVSSPDRSIASGLTVAGPEQSRDPATGQFVSNQEKNTPAADTSKSAVTDTSGEENGELADPEIEAVLAKYNGDVNAALKGLAGAQSLIGRRDERADTLERELAEMRGKLEGFMAAGGAAAASAPALSNDQIVEVAASRIETLGYEQAATEAANVAHKSGDDRALRSVLEQWQIEDGFAAMDFLTEFRLWQRDQRDGAQAPTQETPAWMTTVAEKVAVDTLTSTISAVAQERGVANDSPIIAKMFDALEEMPKNVVQMVGSDDPEAQAEAVRLVMDRATLLVGAAVQAAAPPAEQAVPPSVARKLAGAAVASGALRPAEKALASEPTTREDAIKEFKRQIVEAPTTSVQSGLTYGPTP